MSKNKSASTSSHSTRPLLKALNQNDNVKEVVKQSADDDVQLFRDGLGFVPAGGVEALKPGVNCVPDVFPDLVDSRTMREAPR